MAVPEETKVVLLVDDDEVFRTRLRLAFEKRGWEAHDSAGGNEAIEIARETGPDLILVDLKMPEESGLDLVPRLRELDSTSKIIILTGYGSIPTALTAMKRGADHYLSKPADVEQILAAYRSLTEMEAEAKVPDSVPSLARVEWEHIQRVLADCSGNISQAAKLLGIHRRSLQRKLSKYPPQR